MAIGREVLLAKIDIKSAYRLVPVHPSDWPLLGMSFKQLVYIDASLPLGLRSAPKVFTAVADALLMDSPLAWGRISTALLGRLYYIQ